MLALHTYPPDKLNRFVGSLGIPSKSGSTPLLSCSKTPIRHPRTQLGRIFYFFCTCLHLPIHRVRGLRSASSLSDRAVKASPLGNRPTPCLKTDGEPQGQITMPLPSSSSTFIMIHAAVSRAATAHRSPVVPQTVSERIKSSGALLLQGISSLCCSAKQNFVRPSAQSRFLQELSS